MKVKNRRTGADRRQKTYSDQFSFVSRQSALLKYLPERRNGKERRKNSIVEK